VPLCLCGERALPLGYPDVPSVGVDLQLARTVADGARRPCRTIAAVDLQGFELGGDVALAGGGLPLESRLGRQHQRDGTVFAGNADSTQRQFVGRAHLDIAIRVLKLQVPGHVLDVDVLGPGEYETAGAA